MDPCACKECIEANERFPCLDPITSTDPNKCDACGHPHSARLPPKAGSPINGCPQYIPQGGVSLGFNTPCIQRLPPLEGTATTDTCGLPYKAHKNTPTSFQPGQISFPQPSSSSSQRGVPQSRVSVLPEFSSSRRDSTASTTHALHTDSHAIVTPPPSTVATQASRTVTTQAPRLDTQAVTNQTRDNNRTRPDNAARLESQSAVGRAQDRATPWVNPVEGPEEAPSREPLFRNIHPGIGLKIPDSRMSALISRLRVHGNLVIHVVLEGGNDIHDIIKEAIFERLQEEGITFSEDLPDDFPFVVVWGDKPRPPNASSSLTLRQPERSWKWVKVSAADIDFWSLSAGKKTEPTVGYVLTNGKSQVTPAKRTLFVAPAVGYFIHSGHHCFPLKLFHGFVSPLHHRVHHACDPPQEDPEEEVKKAVPCLDECSSSDQFLPIHRDFPDGLPLCDRWAKHLATEQQSSGTRTRKGKGRASTPVGLFLEEEDAPLSPPVVQSPSWSPPPLEQVISTRPLPPASTRPPSIDILSDDDDALQLAIHLSRNEAVPSEAGPASRSGQSSCTTRSASSTSSSTPSVVSILGRRQDRSPELGVDHRCTRRRLHEVPIAEATAPAIVATSATPPATVSGPGMNLQHLTLDDYFIYITTRRPSVSDNPRITIRNKVVMRQDDDDIRRQIKTLDFNVIARYFMDCLEHRMGGRRPLDGPEDVQITFPDNNRYDLIDMFFSLHLTCGPSLPPALMTAVMDNLQKQQHLWLSINTSLVIPKTAVLMGTSQATARVKAFGRATYLYIFYNRALPRGWSPAFFEAIIHGQSSVCDLKWLKRFHPSAATMLEHWGFNPTVAVENNDWNETTAELLSMELSDINCLDVAGREQVLDQLVAHCVLGINVGPHTFDNHPFILAFKEGFLIPFGNDGLNVGTAFGSNSKSILIALSDNFPKDGHCLDDKIKWTSTNNPTLVAREVKWSSYLHRYLQGTGHVESDKLNDIVPPMIREKCRKDAGLRARLFLMLMTGSETLPGDKQLHIQFEENEPERTYRPNMNEPAGEASDEQDKVMLVTCSSMPCTHVDHMDEKPQIPYIFEAHSCGKSGNAYLGPGVIELLDSLADDPANEKEMRREVASLGTCTLASQTRTRSGQVPPPAMRPPRRQQEGIHNGRENEEKPDEGQDTLIEPDIEKLELDFINYDGTENQHSHGSSPLTPTSSLPSPALSEHHAQEFSPSEHHATIETGNIQGLEVPPVAPVDVGRDTQDDRLSAGRDEQDRRSVEQTPSQGKAFMYPMVSHALILLVMKQLQVPLPLFSDGSLRWQQAGSSDCWHFRVTLVTVQRNPEKLPQPSRTTTHKKKLSPIAQTTARALL
ncbi:hypothetical protein V5O48_016371 [Marasmius crinis-equi]|uniref:Uncharacterized protein n=1 Tax=Marasmius crinis-equi TaxID=585013 RepID=A0ABR3ES67_9AGAR